MLRQIFKQRKRHQAEMKIKTEQPISCVKRKERNLDL